MAAKELKTFEDIYTMICDMARHDVTDDNTLDRVKRIINAVYINEVCPQKRWWWLKKNDNIATVADYTTGTVTIAEGSPTIAGSGTTFTSGMENRKVKFAGYEEIYQILTFGSSIELTLYDNLTKSGGLSAVTYSIYQDEYELPTDCWEVCDIYNDHIGKPMKELTNQAFRELQQAYPTYTGAPSVYTLYGFVNPTPSATSPRSIQVWPVPDEAYMMRLTYTRRPSALENTTDEPLIPYNNRIVLVKGGWAYLAAELRDERASMIMQDYMNYRDNEMAATVDPSEDTVRFIPKIMKAKTRRTSRIDYGENVYKQ
jgi:hypothetical protein